MAKDFYFLCGLPRSGNTLLGSIINQNPDFCVTANSICADMMGHLFRLKHHDIFRNFPDHESFNNVAHNVLDMYYRDYPQQYILDRAPWGMPVNLDNLKAARSRPIRMIVLLRDVLEVLASLIDFAGRQPDAYINRFWAKTVEEKCELLMDREGPIVKELEAVENLMRPENRSLSLFVEYDDLLAKPKETVDAIYDFLGVPYFNHRFENLQQFSVNELQYDDAVLGEGLHRVKPGGLEKTRRRIGDFLPPSVIKKYKNLNSWRNE